MVLKTTNARRCACLSFKKLKNVPQTFFIYETTRYKDKPPLMPSSLEVPTSSWTTKFISMTYPKISHKLSFVTLSNLVHSPGQYQALRSKKAQIGVASKANFRKGNIQKYPQRRKSRLHRRRMAALHCHAKRMKTINEMKRSIFLHSPPFRVLLMLKVRFKLSFRWLWSRQTWKRQNGVLLRLSVSTHFNAALTFSHHHVQKHDRE